MPELADVEIDLKGPGRGSVKVDGREVNCSGVSIEAHVGEITRVSVELPVPRLRLRLAGALVRFTGGSWRDRRQARRRIREERPERVTIVAKGPE